MVGFSLLEHFAQHTDHLVGGRHRELAEFFHKPGFVHGSELIQDDLTLDALKSAFHTGRVISPLGRHRDDDNRADVVIHFVRRDHHAGPCLFNLAPDRRIQCHEENLESIHFQSHSSLSQRVAGV